MDEANPCYSLVMQFMSLFGWDFPCSKFYIKTLLYLQDNTFAPVDIVLLSLLLTITDFELNKFSKTFSIFYNLLVRNQQWKHQSNVSNLFKVNNKNVTSTSGQTHFKNLAANVQDF